MFLRAASWCYQTWFCVAGRGGYLGDVLWSGRGADSVHGCQIWKAGACLKVVFSEVFKQQATEGCVRCVTSVCSSDRDLSHWDMFTSPLKAVNRDLTAV